MAKTTFSRRDIMRLVGGAALLVDPVLRGRTARAAGASTPRLATFYYANGPTANIDQMFPSRMGDGWDWSKPNLLTKALAPHQSYMHIAYDLWINNGSRPKGAHGGAVVLWSTGSGPLLDLNVDNHRASNASIDQWYADVTKTRKLYLGYAVSARAPLRSSYDGPGRPGTPEVDLKRAYDGLFGGISDGAGQTFDLDAYRKRHRRELFVLDAINTDLKASQRLFGFSAPERERLQRYEAMIADLEKDLRAALANPTPPSAQGKPQVVFANDLRGSVKAALDIMVGAMALGLRNATAYQLGVAYSGPNYTSIGGPSGHHSAQHGSGQESARKATIWIHEQVAYMLQKMRGVDMGAGRNLLDESVVLVGCDTPHGANHNYNISHPTFLFGKAGGRLKGGVEAPRTPGAHRDLVDMIATAAEALGAGAPNMFTDKTGAGRRFSGFIKEFLTNPPA
jgi:hypothetical protein